MSKAARAGKLALFKSNTPSFTLYLIEFQPFWTFWSWLDLQSDQRPFLLFPILKIPTLSWRCNDWHGSRTRGLASWVWLLTRTAFMTGHKLTPLPTLKAQRESYLFKTRGFLGSGDRQLPEPQRIHKWVRKSIQIHKLPCNLLSSSADKKNTEFSRSR